MGDSLKNAGKTDEGEHCLAMSHKLMKGVEGIAAADIFSFLNEKYPFNLQEKWDNSGFLVNTGNKNCRKILLSLDITNFAVREASLKNADLIISHHPVIFDPIRKVDRFDPVYNLIENGISAICMHTNLDIADGGTNTVILRKIAQKLKLSDNIEPLEDSGLGFILEVEEPIDVDELSVILKKVFKAECIKVSRYGKRIISKIAVCSGSGGSLMRLADEKGCDAMITGDVKHDVWIDSNNRFLRYLTAVTFIRKTLSCVN